MLTRSTPKLLLFGALLAMVTPVQAQNAQKMYRYFDADGKMVVDYRVPDEYVAGGYEVLNAKGMVIEVVPRELSDEEKARRDSEEARRLAAEEEAERLRKWDESLLLRYSTIEDIEAARDRALRELEIRVSILKSNKRSLKQQVENYQAQAADLERSGREVDLQRLQTIESLQGEIAATDRAIVDREQEIEDVSAAYQKDIDRFGMLLEVVALRRSMVAGDQADQTAGQDPRR